MKIIYNTLSTKKILEIIHYNKAIQKKFDVDINNYRDFSPIKIEIIPIKGINDYFINITDNDYFPFFHIYFDNDKEEKERIYLNNQDKVNKIKVVIDKDVKSFYKLFYQINSIKSIKFTQFCRRNITNMSYMFCEC